MQGWAIAIYERRSLAGLWWVPILALLILGVSASLPVLLYLREGNASQPS